MTKIVKVITKRISEEELQQLKENEDLQKTETSSEEIDLVGFRKVVDYLTELQLPLVVHNGFLDMLHVKTIFIIPNL